MRYGRDADAAYSDSIPCYVREVDITTYPEAIAIGEYETFICDETPPYEKSDGVLSWSVIEGGAEIAFTPDCDTTVVGMGSKAGTALVQVKYEGTGDPPRPGKLETRPGGQAGDWKLERISRRAGEGACATRLALFGGRDYVAHPSPGMGQRLLNGDGDDATEEGMFDPNGTAQA